MNEYQKTGLFLAVSMGLGGLALFTGSASPDRHQQFSDQGDKFYEGFTDPLLAASLEVIDYDETSGTATPFKVQVKDGAWTIPSHYDYRADGETRLANTASAVIDLRKDLVQSDRLQDQEALGVIDPLDETNPSLKGRGKRITLRDQADSILADFIIGNEVPNKQGYRYVRLPEKKRIYAVKIDIDISARFADWIETDLLLLKNLDIKNININDYTIDEVSGTALSNGTISLNYTDNTWSMEDPPPLKALVTSKVSAMTRALSGITITGVRPKPKGLSSDLSTSDGISMDMPTRLSLQSKGYYVSQDGRLLSNEGEVSLGTTQGVRYMLRFGEILIGEGMEISAGAESDSEASSSGSIVENRYLFVTAELDVTLLGEQPQPPEDPATTPASDDESQTEEQDNDARALLQAEYERNLDMWNQQVQDSQEIARKLNDRFAPWYYVISSSDFNNIRLSRDDLLIDAAIAPETTTAPADLPPGD